MSYLSVAWLPDENKKVGGQRQVTYRQKRKGCSRSVTYSNRSVNRGNVRSDRSEAAHTGLKDLLADISEFYLP